MEPSARFRGRADSVAPPSAYRTPAAGQFRYEGEAALLVEGLDKVYGDGTAALDGLATTNGYVFDTPRYFGVNLLAMRLGLRFNNKVDESQDVTPSTRLRRKQVAWSLYRATTIDDWVVPYLEAQYEGMVLPRMGAARRSIVDWGVRYVGYPYIWAGEWGFKSESPAAFGSQPGPGFDCSGLSWWALRAEHGDRSAGLRLPAAHEQHVRGLAPAQERLGGAALLRRRVTIVNRRGLHARAAAARRGRSRGAGRDVVRAGGRLEAARGPASWR